jgi:murein L,D-transpeptidase YcbB/YkuD
MGTGALAQVSTKQGLAFKLAALASVCVLSAAPAAQAQGIAGWLGLGNNEAAAQKPLSAKQRQQVLAFLETAPQHGLAPYRLSDDASDADLTRAAVSFASALKGGRMQGKFTGDWHLRPEPYDAAGAFRTAVNKNKIRQWTEQLAPRYEGYAELQSALTRYRDLQAAGGWKQLTATKKALKVGSKGAPVLQLRERLGMEYAAPIPEGDASTFDQTLSDALKDEQRRLGVPVTGLLDKPTVAALNVPVSERIATIETNLERWRWLPASLPRYRVEVNVPNYWVTVIRGSQEPLTMKVIVGKPATPTPMFQDVMDGVVFNPPWNVPDSIAKRDILPKAKKDKTYLVKNDYVLTDDGRVQQKAGPKSALGKVKFELTNPFAIYLHDTPSKQLFDYDMRAFSNGCLRVEKPLELVQMVLDEDGGQVAQTISTGETQRAAVGKPVPVFVVYRTAFVEGGKVQFRGDLYGWDRQLREILGGEMQKT